SKDVEAGPPAELRGLSLTQRPCGPDRAARPCRLLDHLVSAGEQGGRHGEAERFRGREVCSNKHRFPSVSNCGREIRLRSTSQFDREAKPAPITTLQAAAVAAFSSTFSTITGVS